MPSVPLQIQNVIKSQHIVFTSALLHYSTYTAIIENRIENGKDLGFRNCFLVYSALN